MLLPDDPHPHAEDALPERCHRVDAAGLAGVPVIRRDLHEPVSLELGQRPIDGRAVDVAEAELGQTRHKPVSVPGLLGQQEKNRRQHEPAWWRQFKPRHTLRCRGPPGPLFRGHAPTSLVPPAGAVNGLTVMAPSSTVQKTLIYSERSRTDTACSRTTSRGQDRGGHIDGD